MGVVIGGVPQFLEDTRRGLFSYDALRSRLADSKYSEMGYKNLSSPVIRLPRLSDNELLALVRRLTKLYQQREGAPVPPATDDEIERFLANALAKAGAEELITPREIIRDYLTLLNILRDNPGATFENLVKDIAFKKAEEEPETKEEEIFEPKQKNKVNLFDIDI
jgi:hypothetical protein